MFYKASPLLFARAKELRQELTDAELLLWSYLRTKPFGFKFRRQHPIGRYVADFFCHPLKLVIEADGSIHQKPEVKEADRRREKDLNDEGLRVIRFTNEEIFYDFNTVIEQITKVITQLMPGTTPKSGNPETETCLRSEDTGKTANKAGCFFTQAQSRKKK